MKPAAALALAFACCLPAATLTEQERNLLLTHLEQSAKRFKASIENVSEAQWKFKPASDRWSIAECAEHVVTVDDMTFGFATTQLLKMPAPAQTPTKVPDEKILSGAADRSTKVKTAPFLEPKGKFPDRPAVLAAFDQSLAKIAAYVRTTQDDLRAHGFQSEGGYRDAYQMLLVLAGHAERHAQQIDEVKADPKYPK
jgi:hypothetical protein